MAVGTVAQIDNVISEAHLENHNKGRQAKHIRDSEVIHEAAKNDANSLAEVGHDVFYGVVAELVAVVDEIDVIAVADIFVGGRDQDRPGNREEEDKGVVGNDGHKIGDEANAEL